MTEHLKLPEGLRQRIQLAAQRRGTSTEQLALEVLAERFPYETPEEKRQSLQEMLAEWKAEDEAMTDEESIANEEVLRAIDSHRTHRKLFEKYVAKQENA